MCGRLCLRLLCSCRSRLADPRLHLLWASAWDAALGWLPLVSFVPLTQSCRRRMCCWRNLLRLRRKGSCGGGCLSCNVWRSVFGRQTWSHTRAFPQFGLGGGGFVADCGLEARRVVANCFANGFRKINLCGMCEASMVARVVMLFVSSLSSREYPWSCFFLEVVEGKFQGAWGPCPVIHSRCAWARVRVANSGCKLNPLPLWGGVCWCFWVSLGLLV